MPIYDFKCRECSKVSEIFLYGIDDHGVRCPHCRSVNVEGLISASYVIRINAAH